jgi:hypothetical protein
VVKVMDTKVRDSSWAIEYGPLGIGDRRSQCLPKFQADDGREIPRDSLGFSWTYYGRVESKEGEMLIKFSNRMSNRCGGQNM